MGPKRAGYAQKVALPINSFTVPFIGINSLVIINTFPLSIMMLFHFLEIKYANGVRGKVDPKILEEITCMSMNMDINVK